MKVGLLLMKSVLTPLLRSVLIPLRLTAATSADVGTEKNSWFRNNNTGNSKWKINNIIEIIISLEISGLFKKGVSESIKYETKEQRGGFLVTLGASLLGHSLIGNGMSNIRVGKETISAGHGFE